MIYDDVMICNIIGLYIYYKTVMWFNIIIYCNMIGWYIYYKTVMSVIP